MGFGLWALRALEFDRIASAVSRLAVTPTGRDRLAGLQPSTDEASIVAAQHATTEGVRFLADHPGFPLRAPSELDAIVNALAIDGRALEPLHLLALGIYLDSIDQSRNTINRLEGAFPILRAIVQAVASFQSEVAQVRGQITESGEVADDASPALRGIRERLRRQRARLRSMLDAYLRGRETAKYLQDQVVTDRNGRYVLVVRAEHRSAISGIIHGASTSGASLFLEPIDTVEINNDIVALQDEEAEEIHRILLALTEAFRGRTDDLERTLDVATELDCVQARARFSQMVQGIEPALAADGAVELRGARHPLLGGRRSFLEDTKNDLRPHLPDVVPVDILLTPPAHVLVIAGPNTGGKTVALKNAGLLAAMAQAGLHIPVEPGSRLPVFKSVFADIGDEQSISANLSTFSAHMTNVISMDRELELPALVLLDEVGAGTDPVEGGALGVAIIDHFRRRGAHLIATTHYDSLKSYASTTEGVVGAAFGFQPETYAPTYRLTYGSPGRSLAIEIAARLGMPASVVSAARDNLSEPEKQLAEHLARIDEDLRKLAHEQGALARQRATVAEAERKVRAREESVAAREERVRRRLDAKVDDQVRDARREIDAVIETLKTRAVELSERAAVRLKSGGRVRAAGLSTGDLGAVRADARAAIDRIAGQHADDDLSARGAGPLGPAESEPAGPIEPGARVMVGGLGLEGVVIDVQGTHADVDVRGKRLRTALRDLRLIAGPPRAGDSRRAGPAEGGPAVQVHLQPREGSLAELNVIGATVDEAVTRLEKFLDQAMLGDVRELRIVHGHGTGQLRRGVTTFLKNHPLVERYETAPDDQGGGGATIAVLKD